jgi:succinate-semialdehyde dehydrogenase/glutarate-semialdehyde dehydrogenase
MPGYFYPPTVVSGVKPGMKIWEEEVFGPVSGAFMCYSCQKKNRKCAADLYERKR